MRRHATRRDRSMRPIPRGGGCRSATVHLRGAVCHVMTLAIEAHTVSAKRWRCAGGPAGVVTLFC